jgi:predicted transcriptional regulator
MIQPNLKFDNWVKILIYIYENRTNDDMIFSTKISKQLNISYSYVIAVCRTLENHSLIKVYKDGRRTIMKLTPLGKDMTEHIIYINNILQNKEMK